MNGDQGHGGGRTDGDGALMAELRAAARRADPLPRLVAEAARDAFAWRDLDAELAALSGDLVLDDRVPAGVRGEVPRLLTFEAAGLTVEVEVIAGAGAARLVGQLVPPQAATVRVHHAGGVVEAAADALGRFSAAGLARGPARLACSLDRDSGDRSTGGGARVVRTDWFVL